MSDQKSWMETTNPFLAAVHETTWKQDWKKRDLIIQFMIHGPGKLSQDEIAMLPDSVVKSPAL